MTKNVEVTPEEFVIIDSMRPAAGMPGNCQWCTNLYHEFCGEPTRDFGRQSCSCICPMPWPEDKEITEADAKLAVEFMATTLEAIYVDSVDLVIDDNGNYGIVVNTIVEANFPHVPVHMAPIPVIANVVDL